MLQASPFSTFCIHLLSLKICILNFEINNLKEKPKITRRWVGGKIIIKKIKVNFISRWRVSAVVGGFVKQVLKK